MIKFDLVASRGPVDQTPLQSCTRVWRHAVSPLEISYIAGIENDAA